ncbi:hypothetical protein LM595_02145 [Candidatus Acetothermia bacterium]|nr:hypothetical protein [Candidatus Acetothermia bacterium]
MREIARSPYWLCYLSISRVFSPIIESESLSYRIRQVFAVPDHYISRFFCSLSILHDMDFGLSPMTT